MGVCSNFSHLGVLDVGKALLGFAWNGGLWLLEMMGWFLVVSCGV